MIDKNLIFLVVDDFEPMRKVTSGQLRSMGVKIDTLTKEQVKYLASWDMGT